MNFILGVTLLILASVVGFRIRKKCFMDLEFLRDFERFLDIVETNVSFSKTPLIKVVEKVEDSFSSSFREVLKNFKEHKRVDYLNKFGGILKDFFSTVGFCDAATQLNIIKQTKCALIEEKRFLVDNKVKGELALKLGVMCGVGLFIIVL